MVCSMSRERAQNRVSVLHLKGALRAPIGPALEHKVHALLRRGERRILLNLAEVSDLDAAGLGELVRVYNTAVAADGVLQIAHAGGRIRTLLTRVGLFELLSVDAAGGDATA
jgi:anti-sigma B factor antagonist